jgi:hypothetical protein
MPNTWGPVFEDRLLYQKLVGIYELSSGILFVFESGRAFIAQEDGPVKFLSFDSVEGILGDEWERICKERDYFIDWVKRVSTQTQSKIALIRK